MVMTTSTQELEQQVREAKKTYQDLRDRYIKACHLEGKEPKSSLLGVVFAQQRVSSIREAVLRAVSATKPTTIPEIFARVKTFGVDSHEVSIRNELSKLKRDGLVQSRGHGLYIKVSEQLQEVAE